MGKVLRRNGEEVNFSPVNVGHQFTSSPGPGIIDLYGNDNVNPLLDTNRGNRAHVGNIRHGQPRAAGCPTPQRKGHLNVRNYT